MPRTREQFQEMKKARREKILNSAAIMYSLMGDKLTIDHISKHAKCSHGIVYHYFRNVDSVVDAIKKSDKYINLKNSLLNVEGENKYYQIKNMLDIYLDLKDDVDVAYKLILIRENDKQSVNKFFHDLIVDGQRDGVICGGNPETMVASLFYLLKGIYITYINAKDKNIALPERDNVAELFKRKII